MLLLAIGIGLPRVAASGAQAQAPQRPGTYPADFGLVLDMQAARKFTANDIQSFVHHVFSMYERATSATRRVGPDAFRPFLDDNVKIDFPDYKIRNWQEFVTWHHWIHDRLVGDDHVLGPIDVHFLSDGRYQAHFVVLWRALFKSGEYNEVRVEQTWTLREQADRDAPVIEEYAAKVADFRARD
jgi:hypothetical protein